MSKKTKEQRKRAKAAKRAAKKKKPGMQVDKFNFRPELDRFVVCPSAGSLCRLRSPIRFLELPPRLGKAGVMANDMITQAR